ncbi:MAG TPA: hypothetical protein PKY77_03710, partial [Phycisphaerae bacterium]|nr:hypothetical protein [Phycisphaerae bacterium]HRY67295.1 hypothetical protein [Phycisphaerae bacterium]HSA28438.1 hypothetical protein [Phycisphaerae bacterium]
LVMSWGYVCRKESVAESLNNAWQELTDQLFVDAGWNMVEVLNAKATNSILSQYTWGLDISGLSGVEVRTGTQFVHNRVVSPFRFPWRSRNPWAHA